MYYLAPDDENTEGVTTVENWGLLSATTSDHDGIQALFALLTKYTDSGATFLLSLDDFDAVASRNPTLLARISDKGGKFAVECNGRKLKGVMDMIKATTPTSDFFKIAHALVPLNPEKTSQSATFNDGSISTKDVISTRIGDDVDDDGGGGGFAICKWENGITYTGFWKRNCFHGLGSKMYSKGGGYKGSWER